MPHVDKMEPKSSKVCVACIQFPTPHLSTKKNLSIAEPLITKAARQGARLILLPELSVNKYVMERTAWDGAESLSAVSPESTVSCLMKLCVSLDIYLGITLIEADHNHFFNTFILINPQGKIEGNRKVRKVRPASHEANFFKGHQNSHLIKTQEFGTIAVGICYENHLSPFENELIYEMCVKKTVIALLLQPHSCPVVKSSDEKMDETLPQLVADVMDKVPVGYAQKFGIPAMFCNKCGLFETKIPFGIPSKETSAPFLGLSKIVDRNGHIVGEAKRNDEEPEIVVAEIELNDRRCREDYDAVETYWGSFSPYPSFLRFAFGFCETLGWMAYHSSVERRVRASRISNDYAWYPSWVVHAAFFAAVGKVVFSKYNQ